MASRKPFRCALLKISGEALAGDKGFGIDHAALSRIAGEIALAHAECPRLGIVVGGGNILRGVDAASIGVPALVGDEMGMVATVLNGMALRAALEAKGLTAAVVSAFPVGRFVEPFDREHCLRHVNAGTVVVFSGGTGNPCFTTDSAAALRAVEIDAEVMVKATQVSGVYDRDPRKHPEAVFFESIGVQEVLERRLGVIDAAGVEILGRKNIPVIVLNLHEPGNLAKALAGQPIGTLIHA